GDSRVPKHTQKVFDGDSRQQPFGKYNKPIIKLSRSIATDAAGENLFLGGLDRRFCWMDLQMGNKPWKKLKHHTAAVRSVAYHKRFPLLATVSDDGTAMVYYARIYSDFSRDNELYPVKRLRGHEKTSDDLSMLHATWHPTQPWLITAGADGTIALFTY
uniref:WD_REPEATS_REGION domain-containing protein n=2 Tax=Caenorhabditis japonica TaxID=281687 RepID=A0A8R1HWE6_CAEJA